ncbi:MAG: bifunctional diguanylate cyclase/phosphodiesterase [Candidatus Eisenbacteria bacterium]
MTPGSPDRAEKDDRVPGTDASSNPYDGFDPISENRRNWRLLVVGRDADGQMNRELDVALGTDHVLVRTESMPLPADIRQNFDAVLLLLTEPSRSGLHWVTRTHAAAPSLPLVALLPEGFDHLAAAAIQSGAQDAIPVGRISECVCPTLTKAIERAHRTARLELEVSHDELTGLPRRRLFLEQIATEIERAQRDSSHTFAVGLLNLDRFKLINDSLGPNYGDQLLVALARRMSRCLRPDDVIARLGGGEFAILVRRLESDNHGPSLCQSLQRETTAPFIFGGHEVFTTASLGIVTNSVQCMDPEDYLRDAGIALHNAKAEGNGRYQVYDVSMHEAAKLRFRREMELRQSITQKDFRLYYQPIIDLPTGRLQGFEALLRWEHPHEGMIPPDQFIPVAEETGLIVPIERWVLRHGCDQLRQWRRLLPPEMGLHLHINLSGKHLGRPELAAELGSIVREMEIDPQWLCLEITESSIVQNHDEAMELLARMRDLGCTLSVDDFGTGYSSLSCLQTYPLDTLKIDRSFVMALGPDAGSRLLVRSIIDLAHGFGLDIVAEGIETEEQLAELREMGCARGQGYLISRPVDRVRATEIVEAAAKGAILMPAGGKRKAA